MYQVFKNNLEGSILATFKVSKKFCDTFLLPETIGLSLKPKHYTKYSLPKILMPTFVINNKMLKTCKANWIFICLAFGRSTTLSTFCLSVVIVEQSIVSTKNKIDIIFLPLSLGPAISPQKFKAYLIYNCFMTTHPTPSSFSTSGSQPFSLHGPLEVKKFPRTP